MKILNDLSFLLKYYDSEDLQYFFESLQEKIVTTFKTETTENERLSGLVWKLMSAAVERVIPQRYSYTRLSKKTREEFIDMASEKIRQNAIKINDPKSSKEEKQSAMFSINTLKLLIALAKQDELF